jgi:hypothetical protein
VLRPNFDETNRNLSPLVSHHHHHHKELITSRSRILLIIYFSHNQHPRKMQEDQVAIVVSFRGNKVELSLENDTTVGVVKSRMVATIDNDDSLKSNDIKLMYMGKVLHDDQSTMTSILFHTKNSKVKSVYRLVATGVSSDSKQAMDDKLRNGLEENTSFIRDDLSDRGKEQVRRRQTLGRQMLQKGQKKGNAINTVSSYGFGRIDILPNLSQQDKARAILESLANDPGVLACMEKHKWKVPSLAELYPEGKVGESEVCVMGLNKNKGQQILLRLRTDDLQGFRKIQSIKKVLYHELAHNVFSEHDGKFFQLMREIERECLHLDWTQGAGLSSGTIITTMESTFTGGTFRLGEGTNEDDSLHNLTTRELAARAALARMTTEEVEIEQNCGCGRDLFLPKPKADDERNGMDLI